MMQYDSGDYKVQFIGAVAREDAKTNPPINLTADQEEWLLSILETDIARSLKGDNPYRQFDADVESLIARWRSSKGDMHAGVANFAATAAFVLMKIEVKYFAVQKEILREQGINV